MDRLFFHRLRLNLEELCRVATLTTFFHRQDQVIFSPRAELQGIQKQL